MSTRVRSTSLRRQSWQRITAAPSLDLRFAETKGLLDAVSGQNLITFTRASSGTFVDAAGVLQTAATNEARFDHNPTTGESLGLLVEEQRTNLLAWSEEFNNASWIKVRASISANTITAPNGSLTADTGIEDATPSSTHNPLIQDATIVANGTHTASIYVRAKERSRGAIWFSSVDSVNYVGGDFNLNTGTITASSAGSGSGASASISNVGGGWFRVSITGSIGGSLTTGRLVLRLADASGSIVYTGDGASGIYIWGAQLEQGSFPTSYIPTTTTAATRSADVASITGSNFSSWYNQSEGTFVAQASSAWASGNIVGSSDGTNNNRIFMGIASGPNSRLLITTLGSTQASITVAYTLNTIAKFAGAYKLNSSNFAQNGTLGTEDTVCTIPTVDRLSIGTNTTVNDFFLNGTIRRITYFPARLSDANLRALTQ